MCYVVLRDNSQIFRDLLSKGTPKLASYLGQVVLDHANHNILVSSSVYLCQKKIENNLFGDAGRLCFWSDQNY